MKLATRIMATGTGLLLGALWSLPAAQAQSQWPDKPVVMVVPWAPGGSTDILALAAIPRREPDLAGTS